MFTSIALSLVSTPDNMAAPCSENISGANVCRPNLLFHFGIARFKILHPLSGKHEIRWKTFDISCSRFI
jgi:hypothetical protein